MGCSTTYGVKYDYDEQTDFSEYKSYDWMPVPDQAKIDTLLADRVKNAVNFELKAKGIQKMSTNPDFLIAQHVGQQDQVRVTDWGYGYLGMHGRYRAGYWRPGGVSTYKYEEGILIIDFVDAKTKKMFWRGTAKANVENVDTPEKSWTIIKAAVNEILKKYPPPSD